MKAPPSPPPRRCHRSQSSRTATLLQEGFLHRVRVLLADDNEEFRAVAARLLEPEFEVVKTVGDGEALLAEALHLEPDVLVLDISMPGMSGIETARHLRA